MGGEIGEEGGEIGEGGRDRRGGWERREEIHAHEGEGDRGTERERNM